MVSSAPVPTAPSVVERLKAALGTYAKVADAIGANRNYVTRWRDAGCIPERWALDVHRLRIKDGWGSITYWDVLLEAEAARNDRRSIAEQ